MYNKRVTACIVLYNPKYQMILDAVNTFLSNGNSKDIVLVDNHSKSGDLAQIAEYYRNNENVHIVQNTGNNGFGSGHNYGFNFLKSNNLLLDYHIILNPDIFILHKTLDILLEHCTENVACVVPKLLNSDGSIQYLNKRKPNIFDMFIRRFLPSFIKKLRYFQNRYDKYISMDIGYNKTYRVEFPSGSFLMVRSEIYSKVNGFDEGFFMYMEDMDLCKRIREYGDILYVENAKVFHQWGRESSKSIKMTIAMIKSMIYYFGKHGYCFI